MSERYPLISQLIQENRIPEFDNLYLDMNGIIHNCSHPNDDDASFRISEHDIFLAVFNYVQHLFSVIRPQKTFFLAIDGVAPRAKMNQQRSRRFRTAKENKETIEKAKRRGEEIPEDEGFDSNCITPGELLFSFVRDEENAIESRTDPFLTCRNALYGSPVAAAQVLYREEGFGGRRLEGRRDYLVGTRGAFSSPSSGSSLVLLPLVSVVWAELTLSSFPSPSTSTGPRRRRTQDHGVHPPFEGSTDLRPERPPLPLRP
jgi:hypothetical protein